MANPQYGQTIAATWEQVVGTKPTDNIHDDYWLFNRFSQGEGFKGFDGGRTINGPIEYALNSTVASYSDTETLNTTRVDCFDEFSFSWREYAGVVVMSELERAKNQGSSRKFDLLAAKLENLRNTFKYKINYDLFNDDGTGNGSKNLGGLKSIVPLDPTTGTVGGINRALFTFWRSKQASGTAKTTVAWDNLPGDMRTMYNNTSAGMSAPHPSFVVTDATTFAGFESRLTAMDQITRTGPNDKGITGYKSTNLMFKDCPVSFDIACTVGYVYFLNPSFLKLAYANGYWMKGFEPVDPANQTADIFKVMTICNLFTTNPRRLGVITGVSAA